MIEEDPRYFAPGGAITPGGPSTWHIVDWKQRRTISVTMDEEQEDDDLAIECLAKNIETLQPGVYRIHVSPDGDKISTSTQPDDETTCPYYPPLGEVERPEGIQTVSRSELREIERLTLNVDLVSHHNRNVVFKYYFLHQFLGKVWNEMNLCMRLPPHPNIVPFDRMVVDEDHGRVVGFTTLFIPGGTLEDSTRVFKLDWLKQLMRVLDDLNLRYGVAHQDIAPRNLLVDSATENLILFDFNYSSCIGDDTMAYGEDKNDVKGVIFTMYEIITRGSHFRSVRHSQQNTQDLENIEWVKHPDVQLDHPVSDYRSAVMEWAEGREGRRLSVYTDAPEYIYWEKMKPPAEQEWHLGNSEGTVIRFLPWKPAKGEGRADNQLGETLVEGHPERLCRPE